LPNTIQPDWKFLLSHPAHFLSLGFGTGLAKKAPGTFGTLVAFPLYYLMAEYDFFTELGIIAVLFLLGIWLCDFTSKALGVSDHGSIVWDEIVAMMLVLTFLPHCYINYSVAFILFRVFDIWKPFPIRQCDAKIKGGVGVMFDDILAAVYTIISVKVLTWMLPHIQALI
jgi:phosphatidylglycerophosphatase A